jgi:hypothetical protein
VPAEAAFLSVNKEAYGAMKQMMRKLGWKSTRQDARMEGWKDGRIEICEKLRLED